MFVRLFGFCFITVVCRARVWILKSNEILTTARNYQVGWQKMMIKRLLLLFDLVWLVSLVRWWLCGKLCMCAFVALYDVLIFWKVCWRRVSKCVSTYLGLLSKTKVLGTCWCKICCDYKNRSSVSRVYCRRCLLARSTYYFSLNFKKVRV